ncbi:MAG: chemotaxis protein CheA [Pseudomonadota bacterium]
MTETTPDSSAGIDPAETFRQEAGDLLLQLEETLLDLESSPSSPDLVDTAFRALHTLKGSGAMFGWEALAAFTHHIESAFSLVRDGKLQVTPDLVSLALAATDHIRTLLEHPQETDTVRGQALLASMAELTAHSSSAMGTKKGVQATTLQEVEKTFRIRWLPGRDILTFGTNPLLLLEELRALGVCTVVSLIDRVPPLEEMDPVGCYLGWEILLTTRRPRSAIDDVFIFVADQSDLTVTEVSSPEEADPSRRLGEILLARGDLEPADIEEGLARQRQQRLGQVLVEMGKVSGDQLATAVGEQHHARETVKTRVDTTAATNTVRVPAERLDSLMDQVGELVIAQARLMQIAMTEGSPLLKSISEDIERLTSSLRDTSMGIRMVPIGTLFGRFRRVVHDLSRELGKTVELTMSGEDTELDKTVIESLNDPIVHLIRNAIDHGIDDGLQRASAGKSAAGQIHLSAQHSGAQVWITIEDDGRGLDRDRIRAKAEERGLLQPGQEVGDHELFACIFQAGFSTASLVTSVSGRGVGMDVVKRAIDSLRGTLEVTSQPGQGTAITLKLPLTLAIVDGLLVRVDKERYVAPLSVVEECVELSHQEDERSGGLNFLNIRGDIVPYIRLRRLFGVVGVPEAFQKVVVVSLGEARVGLVVDQVIGQHQTVIKSLSRLHRDQEGFSGATILGDGTVALILDIPHLIAYARERQGVRRISKAS